jgi:hypothetical protein
MNHEIKNLTKDQFLEIVAETIHEAWVNWSKDIAQSEKISEERLQRWKTLWEAKCYQIPSAYKQKEYEYAESILRKLGLIEK